MKPNSFNLSESLLDEVYELMRRAIANGTIRAATSHYFISLAHVFRRASASSTSLSV